MLKLINNQWIITSVYRTAPNIGLIKYWGKWNEAEIIPLNTNIGVTLNSDHVYTHTSLKIVPNQADQLIINHKDFPISKRIQRIFSMFRDKQDILKANQAQLYNNSPKDCLIGELIPNISKYGIVVESTNSFPTGSGLASSSSGLSALALCLSDILKNNTAFDARYFSRIGSGSACRCLFGNLVEFPGVSIDNLDKSDSAVVKQESNRCLPFELQESKWLQNQTQIVILTDKYVGQKEVLSSEGMARTWQTSALIQSRVRTHVNENITQLKSALSQQDFNGVMQVIMRDSNQFHATCLDTYPPLLYLNDFSRQIISLVHKFNKQSKYHVGYTFDAGAHAVLLMHNESAQQFKQYLLDLGLEDRQQIWTNIGNGPKKL